MTERALGIRAVSPARPIRGDVQMKGQQLEGQRQSNEFLLKRVEDLEKQIASLSGVPGIPPVGTD